MVGGNNPSYVLNRTFWASLGGLVSDGVSFSVRPLRGDYAEWARGTKTISSNDASEIDGPAVPFSTGISHEIRSANRGQPTQLHVAASLGDIQGLIRLLGSPKTAVTLNAGDNRQYTAFHVACASGDAQCVSALLRSGVDTELCCDNGRTGWELAEQLKRTSVLALRHTAAADGATPPPRVAASGDARVAEKASRKEAKKVKRREKKAKARGSGGSPLLEQKAVASLATTRLVL